jgi:hypothetical protein
MTANDVSPAIVNPFALKDEDGFVWVKGNLHSHTTNSDGKPTPQERVDGYGDQGYDFLCLSDHYTITRTSSVSAPDRLVLIQGAELHPDNPFGGQRHHFLCLNLQEDIDSVNMPPQHVIDEVRRQGGCVWLAHPFWSSINVIRDVLPLRGFAGIEVFNTTCRCQGRGESSTHWNDWMEQEDRLYPALANDDSHALEGQQKDTYQACTMARVKERSAQSIVDALVEGSTYCSTGPQIHDISLRRVESPDDDKPLVEATISCSEAQRILAVSDTYGREYRIPGETFDKATFTVHQLSRWVRFEVHAPDGSKAWSNPFDLR